MFDWFAIGVTLSFACKHYFEFLSVLSEIENRNEKFPFCNICHQFEHGNLAIPIYSTQYKPPVFDFAKPVAAFRKQTAPTHKTVSRAKYIAFSHKIGYMFR